MALGHSTLILGRWQMNTVPSGRSREMIRICRVKRLPDVTCHQHGPPIGLGQTMPGMRPAELRRCKRLCRHCSSDAGAYWALWWRNRLGCFSGVHFQHLGNYGCHFELRGWSDRNGCSATPRCRINIQQLAAGVSTTVHLVVEPWVYPAMAAIEL